MRRAIDFFRLATPIGEIATLASLMTRRADAPATPPRPAEPSAPSASPTSGDPVGLRLVAEPDRAAAGSASARP
jgi:hypothetical protein